MISSIFQATLSQKTQALRFRKKVNVFVTPLCQAPLSLEFSKQEYWGGQPIPSPGDLPDPGISSVKFSSVTHLCLTLCHPMDCSIQTSLSITNSWSLLKLMSNKSVMPSNYLIFCCSLLQPSNFPQIRVFSNQSLLCIRWPKYQNLSFSISPSNECLGWTGWISLKSKGLSKVFSNTTVQQHQFLSTQFSV